MERDFFTILDQALARLHSHGRVTYKTLQLQFHLDDTHLAALKEELLYTHPEIVDDAGRGLIWTGSLPRLDQLHSPPAEPTDATVETASSTVGCGAGAARSACPPCPGGGTAAAHGAVL